MQKFLKSELGRSMVEMLGVLALVGVLSVVAMAGYSYAITKWKANETLSEIGQRAMEESLFLMKPSTNPVLGMALPETDFGAVSSLGYAVQAFVSDVNADYFEIVLQNIPSNVCAQLVRDDEISIGIFVGETAVNGEPSLCGEEETTPEMSFIFRSDLSRFNNCSQKGYFDLMDLSCHCLGNTYIDSETNECLCPVGHVWSEDEKTCVPSVCPTDEDGRQYFLTLNGCVLCSEPGTFRVSGDDAIRLCNACPNRSYHSAYSNCLQDDKCGTQQVMDMWGGCRDCSKETDILIGTSDSSVTGFKQCVACASPNEREVIFGICMKKNKCELKKNFYYNTDGSSTGCADCSSSSKFRIVNGSGVTSSKADEFCTACENEKGQKNRKISGSYCIKSLCDEGEFQGKDGSCYSCSKQEAVSIGTDASLITQCEAATCGRQAVNGSCVLACPSGGTHLKTAAGACYPCSQTASITATELECAQCTSPTRFMYENKCILSTLCKKGEQYPVYTGDSCYNCKTNKGRAGYGAVAQEWCEACSQTTGKQHHIANLAYGSCVFDDTCTTGEEFLMALSWDAVGCSPCTYEQSKEIGTRPKDRAQCLACRTMSRFWHGRSCWPCTTSEVLTVSSPEERESCLSCKERTVTDDDLCVLKQ